MEILRIEGDFVILVYNPAREHVRVGENIAIIDRRDERGIIVQVIETAVPDLPGILLNIIRREASESEMKRHRPSDMTERYLAVENMKYARARILREITRRENGALYYERWQGYVPSRNSDFQRIGEEELINSLRCQRFGRIV
jgi:hypothetical protein